MITAVLILTLLALVLFLLAVHRKDGSHTKGLLVGAGIFRAYLPLLLLAFLAAGLLQVVLPTELVQQWLGVEAGWRGILIGSAAGMLVAAGPYVAFPIFATILQSGAGIGTAVALVTSWCLMNLTKIPFETALLGPRFTAARISIVILMPVIAGFIAQFFFAAAL
ncbi:MAG: permease [Bacillota bacterium]|nr:permease [Bacillota bacterium]MDW7683617.1 permease [Bacillota bacterium]